MKTLYILIVLGVVASTCAAQESDRRTNHVAQALPSSWVDDKTEITCKAAYYRRASDDHLVPVEEARRDGKLTVSGVVLSVVEPARLAGQVLSLHFDFPEPWDHWYKPDVLYAGVVPTAYIGRLRFMCDSGSLTNRASEAPNPQGGANGRHPFGSETNRTSEAAAPRRSPCR